MDKLNNEDFAVTETISEAAASILKHSFAVYRVDEETAEAIRAAWLQARRFFASLDNGESAAISLHRVVHGHLHGFHAPSKAKLLYRAFCGSSGQPWPNEEFRKTSQHLADKLHRLLTDCYNAMNRNVHDKHAHNNEVSSKRLKRTTPMMSGIPESSEITNDCPLDYFLYHGDKPSVVSCSEHVDRGVLICVCLTNVPGLEVRPRPRGSTQKEATTCFICPEVYVHNASLYTDRQACPGGLVCIMAGDELKQMIHSAEVTACVHRVRNELRESRLSITYELRASRTTTAESNRQLAR